MRGLDHVIALDQSEVRNVGVRSVRRPAAAKRNCNQMKYFHTTCSLYLPVGWGAIKKIPDENCIVMGAGHDLKFVKL